MIKRVIVAYPNQAPKIFDDPQLGEEAVLLWRSELAEMARHFGEKRVEASLTSWIRISEYMPEISQVRNGVTPDFNAKSKFDPACECGGTGFRLAPGSKTHWTKCDCYTRYAMKQTA
jgi:hypothetical protein